MGEERTRVYLDMREDVSGDTAFIITQTDKGPVDRRVVNSLYLSEEQARELYFALEERLNNL